jgi:hypothetical protein
MPPQLRWVQHCDNSIIPNIHTKQWLDDTVSWNDIIERAIQLIECNGKRSHKGHASGGGIS